MTWRVVARQEADLVVGSRSGKALLWLLGVVVVLAGYLYPVLGAEPYTTARFGGFAVGWLTTIVPLVGIAIGYNAVVNERESGALLLSLSLPHSRGALVLGKVAGRLGVLAGAVAGGTILAGWLVVYPFGRLELLPFLGFLLASVWFALVWGALGIAVSLSVATKGRARILGFGLFFLFVVAWDGLAGGLEFVLEVLGILDGDLPAPAEFVVGLRPGHVFGRVTTGFVDPSAGLGGPWYLGRWVALLLFVAWGLVPLGLAVRRFLRGDLA